MPYTIADIATMTGAGWLQVGNGGFVNHLLIDSRKLLFPSTSIFFALVSAGRNGHQFIGNLYQQGVRHFVVSEQIDIAGLPEANLLRVENTLHALQLLAAKHREKFSIPVIGITGSNGKTIVKEWLHQLLEPGMQLVRSPRSYNSQIGVPLSVWLMDARHEMAIFEAGISRSGEMALLEPIIRPTIGIFTSLGTAHNEGFASMQEKLEEKWQLFEHSQTVIYKRDFGLVDEMAGKGIAHCPELFRWSFEGAAEMLVKILDRKENQTVCSISTGDNQFEVAIPFSDEASLDNALTCCATLVYLGLPVENIQTGIAQLHRMAMRLELKEGINHCSVINDSYSADLSSLGIALDFLSQQQQHLRKTVILSDIPEAGLGPGELYERIGALLKHHGVGRLLAIGPVISEYRQTIEDYGTPVVSFLSTENFLQHFEELSFQDETILIKGARRFGFEVISALLEMQVHQTVMEINLNSMLNNLRQYQQFLQPGTRLMAMVKAFSYGSGSFEIANLLQFHGVDYLAVAYTDEGVALRKAGINLPIMVMNADPAGFDALVTNNLEPVVYSLRLYRLLEGFIRQEGIPLYPVHIEVETGMNRLGFSHQDLPELKELMRSPVFKIQSVFSHLAASEEAAHDDYTRLQAARFLEFCNQLSALLPYSFLRHLENTAAIFRHPQWQFDMVRLGIGLYGIDPAVTGKLRLEEVSTLKTTIAQIKYLEAGETVGYGRRGKITNPTTIATVRIGYADGYPRILGNGNGQMLVGNRLAPVVGSICMDMTMIDITGIQDVKEGDEVVVFGKGLPVGTVAKWAGTIPYEMLTGISQRVKRIYYQD